jgi:hypothetical protein
MARTHLGASISAAVLVFNSKVRVNYLVVKNFYIEDVFCASISAAVLVYDSKVNANYLVGKKFFIEFLLTFVFSFFKAIELLAYLSQFLRFPSKDIFFVSIKF